MSSRQTHERRQARVVAAVRDQLDELPYGPSSPCGLCGDTVVGQRHRIIDAIAERIRAGEAWPSVVNDWLGYDPDESVWSDVERGVAADMAIYALAVSHD